MTAQEIVDQINSMDLWSPGILEDVLADAGFDRGFVSGAPAPRGYCVECQRRQQAAGRENDK